MQPALLLLLLQHLPLICSGGSEDCTWRPGPLHTGCGAWAEQWRSRSLQPGKWYPCMKAMGDTGAMSNAPIMSDTHTPCVEQGTAFMKKGKKRYGLGTAVSRAVPCCRQCSRSKTINSSSSSPLSCVSVLCAWLRQSYADSVV